MKDNPLMKKTSLFALALLTSAALALPAAQALAADAGTPAKTTKATKTAKKKSTKHVTKKGVPRKTAKKIEAQTPPQTLTERLTDAELANAKYVYVGAFPCDLGSHVEVTADQTNPGFFTVTSGTHHYFMHPVESKTGAIRLEDNRQGAVWLQLGNKSMLMDQKSGQRVADDCLAAEQKDFIAHEQEHPQAPLLGTSSPMGSQNPQAPSLGASSPAGSQNPQALLLGASSPAGSQNPPAPSLGASSPTGDQNPQAPSPGTSSPAGSQN
jgi:hypothetical protein